MTRQKTGAPMVIVAGHITVEPQQRESYLAGCVSVVEQARGTTGCLDFAITADLIDPGRVNVFERWESQAAVETFRGSGPSNGLHVSLVGATGSITGPTLKVDLQPQPPDKKH